MKQTTKTIGRGIEMPKNECKDKKCPFHGNLKIRGRNFEGTVISKDVHNSATVEWVRRRFIRKYERYEKRRSRVRVHNPPCINAQIGDTVQIYECRPLSKTKNKVIVKVLGEDIQYKQKQEIMKEEQEAAEKQRMKKEKKETREAAEE